MLLDMEDKILEQIKLQGENDGVCYRLYLSGKLRYGGGDIISLAVEVNSDNLFVWTIDDDDMWQYTYTLDEIREGEPEVYDAIIAEARELLKC